jgi:hypothetical protein
MVLFLAIHVLLRPFSLTLDNYAETIAEVTLVILCLFLISGGSPISTEMAGGLTAMCLVVGVVFALRVLLSRYSKLMNQLAGGKEKRGRSSAATEMSVSRPANSAREVVSPRQVLASSPAPQPVLVELDDQAPAAAPAAARASVAAPPPPDEQPPASAEAPLRIEPEAAAAAAAPRSSSAGAADSLGQV